MNEVFETLSGVLEELRSESGGREYSVQTEDVQKAEQELKKKSRAYEKFLLSQTEKDRKFLEDYMEVLDHAHYKEEQRAYYQGIVDAIQILEGLGIIPRTVNIKELLEKISG